ncbi:MAG: hypothetical protein M2R45_00739 [Verrucomicrobia subdivision 3 bacterium]|nr:hypothetical protein [Limisphaerales bacterium]MCS1413154.1 hypothetical protein [Limisphaerales bacterium]
MHQIRTLSLALLVGLLGNMPLMQAAELEGAESTGAKFAAFEKQLTNATLVGQFTTKGQVNGTGKKEEYAISSVKKMPTGDFWLFKARIKYGGTDITLPMSLEVKWAGDTPIITLTETTIPGLGTFSARVVIYDGQYAGIWKHDEYGGQMFGEIRKTEE